MKSKVRLFIHSFSQLSRAENSLLIQLFGETETTADAVICSVSNRTNKIVQCVCVHRNEEPNRGE